MKKLMTAICLALLCAAAIVQVPHADAALGVDFSQTVSYENGGSLGTFTEPYTVVGWSFTPTRDLLLSGLGLWDQDVEKRHSESHLVGIWDSNQNLLASVAVAEPIGAAHNVVTGSYGAQYHMESLSTPLLLSQGQTYYVGATLYANPDFDAFASFSGGYNVSVNSNITFLSNAYGTSNVNQLVFPDQVDTVSTYLVGANIDVTPVPLPAAAWLFGPGLVALVGARRRLGRR